MAKLLWDQVGERLYETGTEKGVLYPQAKTGEYEAGVAWNGLIAVRQSPDGADETEIYADNIKYLSLTSQEEFKGSIEAYTYPEEFAQHDGSKELAPGVYVGQQARRPFGLSYLTQIGNDTEYEDYGQKLHLIYGAKVAPSQRDYETINDTPDAITFSWDFTTTPQQVETEGVRPSAVLTIDSTKVDAEDWKTLLEMVHGTEDEEPELPSIDDVIALLGTVGP